jgi:uncharacterized coiled-coil DUF342 family protein
METNNQNRPFTISTKVSSTQKAKYIDKANKHNLSLSEWICGTLDMSIDAYEDVNKITEIKQLQEESSEKDKKIASLYSRLEIVRSHLDFKNEKVLQHAKTIFELKKTIEYLTSENRMKNYREY